MQLSGKVVIITGGSRGIGKATAKLFEKKGAKVVITPKNSKALKIAANEIGNVIPIPADIRIEKDVQKVVEKTMKKFGNKLLDKMTNLASELPFRDTQSGFRGYSKKAVGLIDFKTNGFGADSEILIDASKKGLKISEERVTVIYDTGIETSTKNPISHSSDVIGSLLELIALKHPLKFLGIPGIILLGIGIGYSIVVITIFNDIRYFSIPSTLIAVTSLITGLMLLLMSVVLFTIARALRRS